MADKKNKKGMKSSEPEAEKEPKIGKRAPVPGGEKNAAGKRNPNKQKEPGKIGSEPVKDKDINRGN